MYLMWSTKHPNWMACIPYLLIQRLVPFKRVTLGGMALVASKNHVNYYFIYFPIILLLLLLTRCAAYITMGSGADSFYEYLLKTWLLTGKKNPKYRNFFSIISFIQIISFT